MKRKQRRTRKQVHQWLGVEAMKAILGKRNV